MQLARGQLPAKCLKAIKSPTNVEEQNQKNTYHVCYHWQNHMHLPTYAHILTHCSHTLACSLTHKNEPIFYYMAVSYIYTYIYKQICGSIYIHISKIYIYTHLLYMNMFCRHMHLHAHLCITQNQNPTVLMIPLLSLRARWCRNLDVFHSGKYAQASRLWSTPQKRQMRSDKK